MCMGNNTFLYGFTGLCVYTAVTYTHQHYSLFDFLHIPILSIENWHIQPRHESFYVFLLLYIGSEVYPLPQLQY